MLLMFYYYFYTPINHRFTMLILIAESKTMTPCRDAVEKDEYITHCPALECGADRVMESLRDISAENLVKDLKLSLPMVRKLQQMVYEFPNKALGSRAIEAFTGVVFKAFGYSSLDNECRRSTEERVRIISSLYGWLRPEDIIKPYRFDFTTRFAPEGKSFNVFWREAVTECLMKEISTTGCRHLLDILPADAARCIDWKKIEPLVEVWKIEFREVLPGGLMKTPNAGKLKTLRGNLLRHIISGGITSPRGLSGLATDLYIHADTDSTTHTITFHTA